MILNKNLFDKDVLNKVQIRLLHFDDINIKNYIKSLISDKKSILKRFE